MWSLLSSAGCVHGHVLAIKWDWGGLLDRLIRDGDTYRLDG